MNHLYFPTGGYFANSLAIMNHLYFPTGGYFANSLAIMTDAAHMLSDFSSFCISLFALWVAKKPATRNMSLGWHRAEVISSLFLSVDYSSSYPAAYFLTE